MEFRRFHYDVVDSTSERAFESLAAGQAHHGDVHVAREQTAGRGRLGRRWHSAPGTGLYTSLVLVLPPPPPTGATLTIAVGLAAWDAVRALGIAAARLKWPNDVVVDGAKVCGVLVESRGLDLQHPQFVVGIGLNVAQHEFPAELLAERPVTSLALLGHAATLDEALEALLSALARRLEPLPGDLDVLARDFLEATGLRGASVRVVAEDAAHFGRLIELSIERGLVLLGPSGARQVFVLEHVRELTPITPEPMR